MANQTHAVGQMHGYMLQVRHMLFELISLDDIVVSVEKIDDVAIETIDGCVVAEQIKSTTSDSNPATDRSIMLWKTLYNWFNYVREGSLSLDKTIFRMVVVSNHELKIGDVVVGIREASTSKEARKTLRAARTNIWGKDGDLRKLVPESYGKYLEVLFLPENEDLFSEIISKITIDVHDIDYDEKLRKKFNGLPIPPEFADVLLENMLGWVTNKVNDFIKQGFPAVLTSGEFSKALTAQISMYNQRNSIPVLSKEVTSEEARIEVRHQDVYIQQLDLIQMNFEEKLEAASDYLRRKTEITIRADKGLFIPQSLRDYNERICRIWKYKRAQMEFSDAEAAIIKGKKLYFQMNEEVVKLAISDEVFPSFFGGGTLQELANKPCEAPKIGWHPNYKELLKGGA